MTIVEINGSFTLSNVDIDEISIVITIYESEVKTINYPLEFIYIYFLVNLDD